MNNATPNKDDLKQQEETLFEAARKLTDPAQREAFLDAACANDSQLRRRLEELLAAQSDADRFFEKSATGFVVPPSGGPAFPGFLGGGLGRWRRDARDFRLGRRLPAQTPVLVGAPPVIPDQMLARIGSVLSRLGQEVQRIKDLETAEASTARRSRSRRSETRNEFQIRFLTSLGRRLGQIATKKCAKSV